MVFQQQEAVIAIAAYAVHLRNPHGFTARQQGQLVGFGGEDGQQFASVAFDKHLIVTVTHAPRRMDFSPGQFGPFADFCAAKMFT
ncbi:hypothetical protein D3C87_1718830 [compost metagenome]